MPQSITALSKDFAQPTLEAWREAAKKSLKGRDPSELDKITEDGLHIHALYCPHNEVRPALAVNNQNFLNLSRIDLPDIADAASQINMDIEQGAAGFVLTLDDNDIQHFGIKISDDRDGEKLLAGIPIKTPLFMEAGRSSKKKADLLLRHRNTINPCFDPLGIAAQHGKFDEVVQDFSSTLSLLKKYNHAGTSFVIDARRFHNAGASDAQELGFALANLVENLRQMDACGVNTKDAFAMHLFKLCTDARQFSSIIKLRAMRLLSIRFAEMLETPAILQLHVETSARMLTAKDTHTNLIRNTLAAFAAIIGGAEQITVLPFTSALGLPDAFARRMAINTLNILREEAHISQTQDAARGSAYVEEQTLKLSEAAWKNFQSIEKQGGFLKALQSGDIQRAIIDKRDARMKAYRTNEKTIVGITAYKDSASLDVTVLKKFEQQIQFTPLALNLWREAQDFESGNMAGKEAAA